VSKKGEGIVYLLSGKTVQTSSFVVLEKNDKGKRTGRLRIYITTMFRKKAIKTIINRTAMWNAISLFSYP
jgi:hypothetical protein